jgi:hypothetical protein
MIVFYYIEKAYRAVKNFLFKKKKGNDSSTDEPDYIY